MTLFSPLATSFLAAFLVFLAPYHFVSNALAAEGFGINRTFQHHPKTCVVSLIQDQDFHNHIFHQTNELLTDMGFQDPELLFDYRNGAVREIRECLQGDYYEEVILISHSAQIIPGHTSLVYQFVDHANDLRWKILNARVFKNLQLGKKLRQITLITCDAEKVIEEYQILKRVAAENNILIKLQPHNLTLEKETGMKLRDSYLIAYMIAESTQNPEAQEFFCLLRIRKILFFFEKAATSCLRNYFKIQYSGFLKYGRYETLWVKVSQDLENNNDFIEVTPLGEYD